MKSQSNIEGDGIEFVLPADREYSTSFELNTTCGITSNISSITFSETCNVSHYLHRLSFHYFTVS